MRYMGDRRIEVLQSLAMYQRLYIFLYVYKMEHTLPNMNVNLFVVGRTISSTVEVGYIFAAHIGTHILEFYYCY